MSDKSATKRDAPAALRRHVGAAGRRPLRAGAAVGIGCAALACIALAVAPSSAGAQAGVRTARPETRSALDAERRSEDARALAAERYGVLIDLDENRLYFRRGDLTLWSAPVGTGTGMRLVSDNQEWDFSTPTGTYQVQHREKDPVWIAPDWFFIENGLPIPPKRHSSRYFPGGLGAAAVYFHPTLAVHGTDRTELLGQAVSHGCIRLENRYALRLYHNVQPGTPVVIVGGDAARRNEALVEPGAGNDDWLAAAPGPETRSGGEAPAGWRSLETPQLLAELDEQLIRPAGESRWDEVAMLLLERAVASDDEALLGLFTRTGATANVRLAHEWATFLVYAYRRATGRSLVVLAALAPSVRADVARTIVDASLLLFHGDIEEPAAPWPTRRILAERVTPEGRPGWDALMAAERDLRDALRRSSRSTRRSSR